MKTSAIVRVIPLAVLCVSGWASLPAQTNQKSTIAKWNLKNSCAELRLESTALVTAPKTLGFSSHFSSSCTPGSDAAVRTKEMDETLPESIPLQEITAAVKEVIEQMPVKHAIDETLSSLEPEKMRDSIEGAGEAAVAAPLYPAILLAAAGAMAPFRGVKTQIVSVRIFWTEDGIVRNANFFLSSNDADALLIRLTKITGVAGTELQFDAELPAGSAVEIVVRFDVPVSMGTVTAFPGIYRMLVMTAADATRVVYLYNGDIALPQDALSIFIVGAFPLGAQNPSAIDLGRSDNRSWCISQVNTMVERLRFQGCPPFSNTHPKF
jgi:hypothetical protein